MAALTPSEYRCQTTKARFPWQSGTCTGLLGAYTRAVLPTRIAYRTVESDRRRVKLLHKPPFVTERRLVCHDQ